MIWLKDGTLLSGDGVRVVITTTAGAGITNRTTASYVRITKFSQSDAGVYQCVFYDTPSQGGEVITTRPYKVDTGLLQVHVNFSVLHSCTRPYTLVPMARCVELFHGCVLHFNGWNFTNLTKLNLQFFLRFNLCLLISNAHLAEHQGALTSIHVGAL